MEGNINIGDLIEPAYMFFDTETTGLPINYNAPTSCLWNWPRLVQLSWIVTNYNLDILSEHDYIIYPEGFTIPYEASSIHGITTQYARQYGVRLSDAINEFLEDFYSVDTIVGHNIDFDKSIVGAELIRLGYRDVMDDKESICTMKSSTYYCQLPWMDGGYKWPKLQELHWILFGYDFGGAHDSMSDVAATLRCFGRLRQLGVV